MQILFERFISLVVRQYNVHPDLAFYADALCVTPKYLSGAVFRASGKHASEWIAESRVMEAKISLRTTDMTLADIASRLNFSSPLHFGRFFKLHTGLTPKQFRNL